MSNTMETVPREGKPAGDGREDATHRLDRLALLSALADADTDAVYLRDTAGVCRMANLSFARVFGAPRERIVGCPLAQALPPATAIAIGRQEETTLADGTQRECELTLETAQGRRSYGVTLGVHRDGSGEVAGVFGRLRDLADRKRLEQAIVEAGECEKRRIAMDLHDGLCQELAAVSLIARLLEKRLGEADRAQGKIAGHIADLTKNLAVSARNLVQSLAPPRLCGEYFVENLRRVAANLCAAFPLQCGIEGDWPERLKDDTVAVHLYRIAHEAMHNAARHSGGNYITVRLRASREAFALFVSDNGHGFAPHAERNCGIGLETMKYRAGLIGGMLKIESAPGHGTTVVCRVAFP
ncbi:MAG: PAS domain-containing protein [Verrucomicrobiota bacterium]